MELRVGICDDSQTDAAYVETFLSAWASGTLPSMWSGFHRQRAFCSATPRKSGLTSSSWTLRWASWME